jgi:post-segregation antitoxin (ccd killing protein)
MPLLNVRLDADDVRRVADLRREGVQISRLVREAIRAEHEQRNRRRGAGRDAAAIMARIYADHPDTPDVRPRRYDLRDRQAVRRAIAARLQKRRV